MVILPSLLSPRDSYRHKKCVEISRYFGVFVIIKGFLGGWRYRKVFGISGNVQIIFYE